MIFFSSYSKISGLHDWTEVWWNDLDIQMENRKMHEWKGFCSGFILVTLSCICFKSLLFPVRFGKPSFITPTTLSHFDTFPLCPHDYLLLKTQQDCPVSSCLLRGSVVCWWGPWTSVADLQRTSCAVLWISGVCFSVYFFLYFHLVTCFPFSLMSCAHIWALLYRSVVSHCLLSCVSSGYVLSFGLTVWPFVFLLLYLVLFLSFVLDSSYPDYQWALGSRGEGRLDIIITYKFGF